MLTGHTGWALAVAVTPDGRQIVSGGADGTVRVWDRGSGREQVALTGHSGLVLTVAVTPDGRQIVSGGADGTVRIWDRGSGREQAVLTGHTGWALAVAVTPDGRQIVSGGADGTVRVWDRGSGREQVALTGHIGWVWTVVVTPDGKSILSGGEDGTVRVWDRGTGQQQADLIGHRGLIWTMAVTPDGRQVASGGADGTVRIWDLSSGHSEAVFNSYAGAVWAVEATPDGRQILSGGEDGTLRAWDLRSMTHESGTFTGRTRLVWAMAVTPDGQCIVSGGADGMVRVWDRGSGREQAALTGHTGAVRAVAITPDGRQITSGGADGMVRVWDRGSGREQAALTGHPGAVRAVAITPDGRLIISAGEDGTVRVWDRGSGREQARLSGRTHLVWAMAVAPDGQCIVSGGADGMVRVWDRGSGQEQAALTGHTGAVRAVAITPDGRQIISGGADGTVRVWDRESGREQASDIGHAGLVWAVAVTPDGTKITSASADRTIREWNRHSRSQIRPAASGRAGPRGTLASVHSDAPSDIDLLGIGDDVEALAKLIAASATEPPLSIALLGKWGTGKSTAMNHIRRRVDELAADSTANPGRTPYKATIRQIDFNAWHYSDDQIWPGLIEHLFRELAGADLPSEDEPERMNDEANRLRIRVRDLESHSVRLDKNLKAFDLPATAEERPSNLPSPFRIFRIAGLVIKGTLTEGRYSKTFWFAWCSFIIAGIAAWVFLAPGIHIAYRALAGIAALAAPVIAAASSIRGRITAFPENARRKLAARLNEVHRHLADTRARLAEVDAAARLTHVLSHHASESVYDPYRGLVGRVNRDLDELQRALVDARNQWRDSNSKASPPLERVVLYIDDLDRCPPRRVVEVLSAVHLLLAKPLFVVVVAVDADWLYRSLLVHHGALLASEDSSSPAWALSSPDPTDWLDKIFQIPYALPPMAGNAEGYISALLPTEADNAASADTSANNELLSQGSGTNTLGLGLSRVPGRPPAPAGKEKQSNNHDIQRSNGRHPADVDTAQNLQPAKLILTEQERKVIPLFGAFLPTPRAGKKFVNLYRLVRIGVNNSDLEDFIGDENGGPYQAVLFLLVVIIGKPLLAHPLFSALRRVADDGDIVEFLNRQPCGEHLQSLCDELSNVIISIRSQGTPLYGSLSAYRGWAPRIARHSFHAQNNPSRSVRPEMTA